MPPRVRSMVGSAAVNAYQADEAEDVLAPIRKLLERKGLAWRCDWKVGEPAAQILAAAERGKAHMIVMGTHGYGAIGRAVMGSVAHRVLQRGADSGAAGALKSFVIPAKAGIQPGGRAAQRRLKAEAPGPRLRGDDGVVNRSPGSCAPPPCSTRARDRSGA